MPTHINENNVYFNIGCLRFSFILYQDYGAFDNLIWNEIYTKKKELKKVSMNDDILVYMYSNYLHSNNPSKHDTLIQCWGNVGPATVVQHCPSIGSMYVVGWDTD